MQLVQYDEHLDSTVVTDGLVLQHHTINSYSAEYMHLCFL